MLYSLASRIRKNRGHIKRLILAIQICSGASAISWNLFSIRFLWRKALEERTLCRLWLHGFPASKPWEERRKSAILSEEIVIIAAREDA